MKVTYIIVLLGLVSIPVSSQVYFMPGLAMAYTNFEWINSYDEYKVATEDNIHLSVGIGLIYELGDNYSLKLHSALYKGRYQVNNAMGFNPVQNIHHGTLDSDISLSRKLGRSIEFGLGFKHLLFYNVTIDRMSQTDDYFKNVNGVGYHLQFTYEVNRFGVLLAYNGLYNYKDDNTSIGYEKSDTLDLRIYYKFLIAKGPRQQ